MLKLFVASAELALPLGLLSAVLIANRSYAPTRRQRVGRLAAASLAAGLAAAVVVVWFRLNTGWIRLPMINLWASTFLVLGQFVLLVALWLPATRTLVTDEPGWAGRLLTGASLYCLALTGFFYGIPLAMASDAVVPMNGTLFASDSALNLAGYLLGVVAVGVTGWAVAVSLGRGPAWARRVVSTLVVGIALVCQWAPLYQQYVSARLLPRNSLNFTALLWIQRNSVAILLAYTALAVVPAVVAVVFRNRALPASAVPAERRLALADALSRRRFLGLSAAVGLGLGVTFTIGKQVAEAVPELSPIEPSVVNGDRIEVELAAVSDGHLHRFAHHTAGGTEVRFIVIQKNATAFGTGLDACEICGPSGYYERDGKVVCRKCDVVMNVQTIGFAGGCNPIPISYDLADGRIRFQVSELEGHAGVFN